MTLSEMKQEAKQRGSHFFDRAAQRFFGSRIVSQLYQNDCFITADWRGEQRIYKIRQYVRETGRVLTIAELPTVERARHFCRTFRAGE